MRLRGPDLSDTVPNGTVIDINAGGFDTPPTRDQIAAGAEAYFPDSGRIVAAVRTIVTTWKIVSMTKQLIISGVRAMTVRRGTPEEWDRLTGLPRQTVVFGTGPRRPSAPPPSSATATSNSGMTSTPPAPTSQSSAPATPRAAVAVMPALPTRGRK
jgi:hypothetical protein